MKLNLKTIIYLITALVISFYCGKFIFNKSSQYPVSDLVKLGASSASYVRNVLPELNSTYDLGSTSPNLQWNNIFAKNVTVSGTCTGCGGGGSLSGGIAKTLTYWIDGTTVGATSSPAVDSITATSTLKTSYFAGNLNLPSLTASTVLMTDSSKNIISSSTPTMNSLNAVLGTATSTFSGGSIFAFSGGNVGIGTTSPQARLTVSEPNFGVNSTNLGRLSNSILLETKATVVGAGSEITFGGLGNLTSATGIYAAISAPVTGNNAASGAAGYLAFSTKGSTVATVLTEAMRITGGQLIGMGTTSPTTVLTVDSSTNSSLWIDPNTTYNGIAFGGKRGAGGWSGGFSFVGNSAGGNAALGGFNAIGGSALTRFVIGTVTTNELISILAAGNVGIGTTTPAQKLEVYKSSGDLYARLDANQSTADVGYILNNSGSNTNSWAVKRNNTTGTFSINRSSATFPTTGTITQPFTINTTDNVGIGTTTMFSQNELTIANGLGPQISLVDGGTAPNAWAFRVMPSGDLAFATSSSATGATTTPNAILFSATGVGLSVGATSTNPVAFATFETANNPRTYQFYLGSSTKTSLVVDNVGAMFAPNTASSGSAQTGYWCYDGSGQFIRTSTACLASSERFKTKITTLDSGINELLKLRPVSYFKKNPLDKADSYEQIGFIAEEAEKVDSRLISYGNDGTIRGFRYDQFTALITKAIQDIWHKITGYDQRIAKLEKDNAELKARLDKLEKKINGK